MKQQYVSRDQKYFGSNSDIQPGFILHQKKKITLAYSHFNVWRGHMEHKQLASGVSYSSRADPPPPRRRHGDATVTPRRRLSDAYWSVSKFQFVHTHRVIAARPDARCLVMPMTLRRNAPRLFASSQCGLLSFFFFDKHTGISRIHQLLNVRAGQGPLCGSATLGNVTRQTSVCHKLSKIIDARCSSSFFFLLFLLTPTESFTFNNPTWLSWRRPSSLLVLANQMEGDRGVGTILNISAGADFDLRLRTP